MRYSFIIGALFFLSACGSKKEVAPKTDAPQEKYEGMKKENQSQREGLFEEVTAEMDESESSECHKPVLNQYIQRLDSDKSVSIAQAQLEADCLQLKYHFSGCNPVRPILIIEKVDLDKKAKTAQVHFALIAKNAGDCEMLISNEQSYYFRDIVPQGYTAEWINTLDQKTLNLQSP